MATVRNAQRRERRGTAAQWAAANPVLKAGELGILQDGDGRVQEIRVGDGTSAWADLGDTALQPKSVLTATYAALVDGKVDPDQLPDLSGIYVQSDDIRHMVVIEESAYAALDPPDAETFYIVVEDS